VKSKWKKNTSQNSSYILLAAFTAILEEFSSMLDLGNLIFHLDFTLRSVFMIRTLIDLYVYIVLLSAFLLDPIQSSI
jgi:hypothetical protein